MGYGNVAPAPVMSAAKAAPENAAAAAMAANVFRVLLRMDDHPLAVGVLVKTWQV
jgi:hypothetical protein